MNNALNSTYKLWWIIGFVTVFLIGLLAINDLVSAESCPECIVVTVSEDAFEDKKNDGQCTLREAIIAANSEKKWNRNDDCKPTSGDDTIGPDTILLKPGVYTLSRTDNGNEDSSSTGDLDIRSDITITSSGSGIVVIEGGENFTDRIFHILSPDGKLTMDRVTIRGGRVKDIGGGIYNEGGTLNVTNSTFYDNTAATSGGALYNDGQATLNYVTVKGNTAPAPMADGLHNGSGTLTLDNSYIDEDSCAGIIDGTMDGNEVFNLGPASCNASEADNAGPVLETINGPNGLPAVFAPQLMPMPGSMAINAGSATGTVCPGTDQLGLPRPQPQSGACDIGAIELVHVNQSPGANDDPDGQVNEDSSVDINVAANDTDPDGNLDPNSISVFSGPNNGTAVPTIGQPGYVTYTPKPHFDGTDTFDYQICDSAPVPLCSTATVTVTVDPDEYIEATNLCDVDEFGATVPGSLRAAFERANSETLHSSGIEQIVFDPYDTSDPSCGADGAINISSPLPSLTEIVNIDGLATDVPDNFVTDPGLTPYITLDGNNTFDSNNNPFSGITVAGGAVGSTLNNLLITEFSANGVVLQGTGSPGIGNIVFNSTIFNNGEAGVAIGSPTVPGDGNSILNNIIDDNCGSGVLIYGYEAIGDGTQPGDLLPTDFEGNLVQGNTITNNGSCGQTFDYGTPDGVTIPVGQNNEIVDNLFEGNEGLAIDLAEDGVTPNDDDDTDEGSNLQQNFPVLQTAIPTTPIPGAGLNNGGEITAWLFSAPNGEYTLHFYSSTSCSPQNLTPLSVEKSVFADSVGDSDPVPGDGVLPVATLSTSTLNDGDFVIATATDANGNTSEFSDCYQVNHGNIVWPRALVATNGSTITQSLNNPNEVRWYRIEAKDPFSKITVKVTRDNPGDGSPTLNNLNADGPTEVGYDIDVVGFNDIGGAYAETVGTKDLNLLAAEFSPDAFDSAKVNGSYINAPFVNQANYLGSYINGSYINGSYINGGLYSADLYAGSYINGSYINNAYLNQADYNGSYINGSYINGSYINGSYINGSYINGSYINGNAYTAAQLSSVITASANDGAEAEEMGMFAYNNPGWYYVRVQGRFGQYNPDIDFNVTFSLESDICSNITDDHGFTRNNPAIDGDYEAIILVDYARMGLTPGSADYNLLENSLNALTNTIHAVIVDLGDEPEVVARNDHADLKWECPYAKNIAADEIKAIIDEYRAINLDGAGKETIENIIVIGSDNHIPFYRYPDQSGLGPESQYVVPVFETTTSFASLASDTFLSQDAYGATAGVAMKNVTMPLPEIPVGRLVETPHQIANMIDVYLNEPVLVPQSAFVTMYDFLIDGGEEVRDDLLDSTLPVTELNSNTWTATDMKTIVNNSANPGAGRLFDIGYLAGHFSATTALAADYATEYKTSDLMELPPNYYAGALIYSAGCHVGYNIVNEHAIPDFTPDNVDEPDWAAGMANMGATFIGGTGYQYGDDEFVEYSERLYAEFTRALRYGDPDEAIAIGNALVNAKKQYLIDTPVMSGIHQKALLEATIFGLPMKSVNLPGDRLDPPPPGVPLFESDLNPVSELPDPALPAAQSVEGASSSPGEVIGLHYYDLNRDDNGQDYNLIEPNPPLFFTNAEDPGGPKVEVSYLLGPDGKVVNAGTPVLPLDKVEVGVIDDVVDGNENDWVLRGVAWLGGEYVDVEGITPLVAAAATESSSVHSGFTTFVDFPQDLFTVNRFDAVDGEGGRTVLNITPAQHRTVQETNPQTSRRREFKNLQFRLLYLPNDFMDNPDLDTGFNRPDLSAGPDFYDIVATPNGSNAVDFEVHADVDPGAGMEEVWISYTTKEVPTENGKYKWIPFFLSQNAVDSTLWEGTLTLPWDIGPENVVFVVSGYSGVGMVTMSNNMGIYYTAGGPRALTELADTSSYPNPVSAEIGASVTLSARLTLEQNQCTSDLKGKPIMFSIGEDFRLGWTDDSCNASASVTLLSTPPTEPGDPGYEITISFPGDADFAPSTADTPELFIVEKGETQILLTPSQVPVDALESDVPLFAQLKDMVEEGRPLAELTVTFIVTDPAAVDPEKPEDLEPFTFFKKAVITDQQGIARLGDITLPGQQDYKVWAVFGGTNTYKPSPIAGSSLLILNRPPDCSKVKVVTINGGKDFLWPSNNKMVELNLVNVSDDPSSNPIDPDGDPVTLHFLEIYQDEAVGPDPDAAITAGDFSCSNAEVRAERDGGGDGRVYHIRFRVVDDKGAFCEATFAEPPEVVGTELTIPVDHDNNNVPFIDGGPLFNSLGEGAPACVPPPPEESSNATGQ